MYDFFYLIVSNQILLTFIAALMGLFASAIIWRRSGPLTWNVADLVWVSVGGCAAISAVVATIYISRLEALSARINAIGSIAFNIAHETDVFAARHCDGIDPSLVAWSNSITRLCLKNSEMANSILRNGQLPLFSDIRSLMPTSSYPKFAVWSLSGSESLSYGAESWSSSDPGQKEKWEGIFAAAKAVAERDPQPEPAAVGIVDPMDDEAIALLSNLSKSGFFNELVADYRTMARRFESITENMVSANSDWLALQGAIAFLAIRVVSIALVALVFPLRVAKSLNELRRLRLQE